MGVFLLWINVVLPWMYPGINQPAPQEDAQQVVAAADDEQPKAEQESADSEPASANGKTETADSKPAEEVNVADTKATSEKPAPKAELKPAEDTGSIAKFPPRTVKIGSPDYQSEYAFEVTLTSKGAAIDSVVLNDPRYPEFNNREEQLAVLSSEVDGASSRTFELGAEIIDTQLMNSGQQLRNINWEYLEEESSQDVAVFRFPAPDGSCELRKTYSLNTTSEEERKTSAQGYQIGLTVEVINKSAQALEMTYQLQGPVGVPVENADYARRHLAMQMGFAENGGGVRHEEFSAQEVFDDTEDDSIERVRTPLHYVGIDGQYFSALILPQEDQLTKQTIAEAAPILLKKGKKEAHSQISLMLQTSPLLVPAEQSASQSFNLYVGPKLRELLTDMQAGETLHYGWFASISEIMLSIMRFFHDSIGLPYGLAIVMLTVVVRACMFPVSVKHAKSAKRMRDMQPKFAELKAKYDNAKTDVEKQKVAQEQFKLMSESGMLTGCLPLFLQIPIFFGLFQALGNAVELRMHSFLWIDNLAAEDALFKLPFEIWFLGDNFNLLPILSVGLIILQQKLFMPPAMNEEQAIQQKMMSYMMIVFGFMFYRWPAGLCVYIITSTGWAVMERKILDYYGPTSRTSEDNSSDSKVIDVTGSKKTKTDKPQGMFGKLMEQLDSAANPKGR